MIKPLLYNKLSYKEKIILRNKYIADQGGLCMYCKSNINHPPPEFITKKKICWEIFPPNFLKYPIHLQHNHETGLTEGAVHSYCNAVMWQYEGK